MGFDIFNALHNIFQSKSYALGYDENALGIKVPFPTFTEKAAKDALKNENGQVKIIDHLHFALAFNVVRKFANVVGGVIKGDCLFDVARSNDKWVEDKNIELQYQILDAVYKLLRFYQRGHMRRRAENTWGETLEEAKLASIATFVYSNAIPQHANFNPDEWLKLENWYLEKIKAYKMRMVTFTGPVFGWDIFHKETGIYIPQAFFKVIAFIHPKTKKPTSAAFLMNQTTLWGDKDGAEKIEVEWFQVMVKMIEVSTGLDFGELKEWDVLSKHPDSGILALDAPKISLDLNRLDTQLASIL